MASGAQDAPDAVSLLRAGEGEAAEHGGADRSGQSLTAGSARFRPPVLIALVAAGAVALCVALYPVPSKGAKPKGAALRHLQDDGFCNSQVSGGYAQSYAFQLPAEWQQKCTGQVASTVQAPPTETQFNTQRNWCWHWMKHKGCKDVIASKNWMEAQQLTAGMGLCPPYEEAPIEPVTNAELCSDPGLGQLDDAAADAASALAWLQTNVAVYVLNLDTDTERLAAVTANLQGLGIEFERIPGLDMRGEGAFEQAVADGRIPSTFDPQVAEQVAGEGVMGTVGVAAAHLAAHQYVVDSAQKPLAIILEDDVQLDADFAVKLQKLVTEEAPCTWQAISLKSGCPHGACVGPHLTRVQPDVNEPAERCRHGSNYGFYGMLYRVSALPTLTAYLSQRVWDANTPHCLDVDVALASIADQLEYYAVPFWQTPGFLSMGGYGSQRNNVNQR